MYEIKIPGQLSRHTSCDIHQEPHAAMKLK